MNARLTEQERQIMAHLVQAWNDFIELDQQNQIDLREFSFHIHALQNILASRVAARVDPDIWSSSDICEGRESYKLRPEHITREERKPG